MRERYGVRAAALCTTALVVANLGTTCAEFAGVAAALGLAGVPVAISVPVAAAAIVTLVLAGSFHRVERVLLALAAALGLYIAAGFLAGADWGAVLHGSLVPSRITTQQQLLAMTATIGTTIAPWGIAFIQSYAVDKRLRPSDLRLERIDVAVGAVLTGVIGLFVVIACAATIHAAGGLIARGRLVGAAVRGRAAGCGAARGHDPAAIDRVLGGRDVRRGVEDRRPAP